MAICRTIQKRFNPEIRPYGFESKSYVVWYEILDDKPPSVEVIPNRYHTEKTREQYVFGYLLAIANRLDGKGFYR